MLILFVHGGEADALLNVLRRAGFLAITRQIAQQLPSERLLPIDVAPVLSVRYGDETVGVDVYDDALAAAMYAGMNDAGKRLTEQRKATA